MKLEKLIQMSKLGYWEARRLGLYKEENWTPLLVHLHTSRMLIGGVLGLGIGFSSGILACLAYLTLRGIL